MGHYGLGLALVEPGAEGHVEPAQGHRIDHVAEDSRNARFLGSADEWDTTGQPAIKTNINLTRFVSAQSHDPNRTEAT